MLMPPQVNPLADNAPAAPLLGVLEMVGVSLTVALLILVIRKDYTRSFHEKSEGGVSVAFVSGFNKPNFKGAAFIAAVMLLAEYCVCWVCCFLGFSKGLIIVLACAALLPLRICVAEKPVRYGCERRLLYRAYDIDRTLLTALHDVS
jgi:hypothetical protein